MKMIVTNCELIDEKSYEYRGRYYQNTNDHCIYFAVQSCDSIRWYLVNVETGEPWRVDIYGFGNPNENLKAIFKEVASVQLEKVEAIA